MTVLLFPGVRHVQRPSFRPIGDPTVRTLAYHLSLRDLVEMMAERCLSIDHSTVHFWSCTFRLNSWSDSTGATASDASLDRRFRSPPVAQPARYGETETVEPLIANGGQFSGRANLDIFYDLTISVTQWT